MALDKLVILLDQGFPEPPGFDPRDLDDRVVYTRLFDFDRRLSDESTPDWKIVLRAAVAGFHALVTDDASMLEEDITLTALCCTDLSLVTWDGGMRDPVTRWAQLLAYTPEIRRHLRAGEPAIFKLPGIRLERRRQVLRASDLVDERASRSGTTGREIRTALRKEMRTELQRDDAEDLIELLSRRPV